MKIWIFSGLLAVIAGAIIFYLNGPFANRAEADTVSNSDPEPQPLPVRTMTIAPRSIDRELRLTGTLRADESIAVRAEISARVVKILFQEGEEVEAGQLLVKLDDAELQAQRNELEAELVFARREETRQRDLLAERSTSERQFEEAETRRALLEAAKETIETRLEKTDLRAPFSGVIGLRYISPGSLVQPETQVASLQRIEPLKIDFAVPERYLAELPDRLDFQIAVAGDSRRYAGTVYAREPAIEPGTRSIQLRGRIDNPEGRLLPGGYAQVFLNLGDGEETLVAPTVAVVPGRESSVFLLKNDTVHRRTVQLGRRTRNEVEILEGLEAGDEIVVAGVQNIRDGQRVRVVNDTPNESPGRIDGP